MIATDLSKQQGLGADPKATQQINFTASLPPDGNADTTIFFIISEAKKKHFRFLKESGLLIKSVSEKKVLVKQFKLNLKNKKVDLFLCH